MTVQQRDFFGMPQTYQAQSSGSGIIINQSDTELLIATNNHVVDGAQDLKVTFVDNNDVSAAVKGTDSASDLAIIAVQLKDIPSDTMSKIKVASLGDSDNIKVGPWIFRRINHYLDTGEILPGPSIEEIQAMILRHGHMLAAYKGEQTAMREMRGHVAWYTKGMPHSAALRNEINQVETLKGLAGLLNQAVPSNPLSIPG